MYLKKAFRIEETLQYEELFPTSFLEEIDLDKELPVWTLIDQMNTYLTHFVFEGFFEELDGVFFRKRELIQVHPTARIEPGSFISGPCIIGKEAEIRFGAYLRGSVIVGPYAVIGHAVEVKNSWILEGAHLSHFNYVGDSVIGPYANLGSHAVCANLRLDRKELLPMQKQKYGALIGQQAEIACHSVIPPGHWIPKQAKFLPKRG